jgi:aspartate racemase
MRRIGLLGGMSWESSALYYEILNAAVRERLGGYHSARVLMSSVDFAEVEAMQAAGEWDAAGALLAAEAAALEAAGAECLVLCTNTMHKVVDAIEAATDIPLIHIVDVTAGPSGRPGCRGSRCSARGSPWSRRSCATGSPRTASRLSSRRARTASWCTR